MLKLCAKLEQGVIVFVYVSCFCEMKETIYTVISFPSNNLISVINYSKIIDLLSLEIIFIYTLNRNNITSPSFTTYSFPSSLTNPFSLAAAILPAVTKSSKLTVSARINPFSKSV